MNEHLHLITFDLYVHHKKKSNELKEKKIMLSSIKVINTHTLLPEVYDHIDMNACIYARITHCNILQYDAKVSKQIKHHTRVRHVPIKAEIKDKDDQQNNRIQEQY
jgi:hypothetical protein